VIMAMTIAGISFLNYGGDFALPAPVSPRRVA